MEEKKVNYGRNIRVDYEEYIREYMRVQKAGGSYKDLAREMGITSLACSARYARLKKIGVVLPKMKNSNEISGYETSRLNQLVQTLSAPPVNVQMKKPPIV